MRLSIHRRHNCGVNLGPENPCQDRAPVDGRAAAGPPEKTMPDPGDPPIAGPPEDPAAAESTRQDSCPILDDPKWHIFGRQNATKRPVRLARIVSDGGHFFRDL